MLKDTRKEALIEAPFLSIEIIQPRYFHSVRNLRKMTRTTARVDVIGFLFLFHCAKGVETEQVASGAVASHCSVQPTP